MSYVFAMSYALRFIDSTLIYRGQRYEKSKIEQNKIAFIFPYSFQTQLAELLYLCKREAAFGNSFRPPLAPPNLGGGAVSSNIFVGFL